MPPSQQLKARLAELGWSQSDLAKAINVSVSVVCRWLNGTRVPSLEHAFRIQESPVALSASIWREAATKDESKRELAADESGEHGAVTAATEPTGTDGS